MRRIPELDALRGIAALVIVVFHLRFTGRYPVLGTAVDLFFVLSGYLITTILFRTCRAPGFYRNFCIRRALRIWPIYYLSFPVFLGLNAILPHPQPIDALPYFLTYTQFVPAYWGGAIPTFSPMYRHTWTLAIEEQFYLVWPWVVRLAGRRGLWAVLIPLAILPTVLRSRGVFGHLLLTRCDGLALGAMLAAVLYDQARLDRHRVAFRVGFGLMGLASLACRIYAIPIQAALAANWPAHPWHMIVPAIALLVTAVMYAGLVGFVLCSVGHPALAVLRDRRLCYLGQISYGMYLYHPMVFTAVALIHFKLGLRGSATIDALKVAACVGLAALSWRFIERPCLARKDRLTLGAGGEMPRAHANGPHFAVNPAIRDKITG